MFFVRETKGKTLEELSQVFAIPLSTHAAYGLRQIPYGFKKFVLFQNPVPEELCAVESDSEVSAPRATRRHNERSGTIWKRGMHDFVGCVVIPLLFHADNHLLLLIF